MIANPSPSAPEPPPQAPASGAAPVEQEVRAETVDSPRSYAKTSSAKTSYSTRPNPPIDPSNPCPCVQPLVDPSHPSTNALVCLKTLGQQAGRYGAPLKVGPLPPSPNLGL